MHPSTLLSAILILFVVTSTGVVPWVVLGHAPSGGVDLDVDEDGVVGDANGDVLEVAVHGGETLETGVHPVEDQLHDGTLADLVEGLGSLDLPVGVLLLRYSRHDDSDPLENEIRHRVYDAVTRSPGTYPVELAERTDIPRSTVRYHLRILEEEGLVVSEKRRGKLRVVPRDADVALSAALNDEASHAVLAAIGQLEPATVTQLADHLDKAPSTVSHHLAGLSDDGLVEQERVNGAVLNRLADETTQELPRAGAPAGADAPATSSETMG